MTISASEYREMTAKPKRNKFGARRVTINDRTYDSEAEARYGEMLLIRARAGEISGLVRQRKFDLLVNGQKIGTWTADFCFFDHTEDRFRVVDVKGVETREFKRTKKHMKALYGIDIEVVK